MDISGISVVIQRLIYPGGRGRFGDEKNDCILSPEVPFLRNSVVYRWWGGNGMVHMVCHQTLYPTMDQSTEIYHGVTTLLVDRKDLTQIIKDLNK